MLIRSMRNIRWTTYVVTLALVLGLFIGGGALITPAHAVDGFVERTGNQFTLNGAPYYFGGTNNYYLTFKSNAMVDDVLEDAAAMDLRVIRLWGFIDRGSLDGSIPNVDGPGHKDNVYFQYWDPATGKPAYNDGPDGLERLDYVLAKADELGLRLTIVLTNNWKEFGGMDQYVTWYDLTYHDQFYTDARVKQAYKDWAKHLINRTNSITGVRYRDDPTIFAWELANEPRCGNGGNKPVSGNCTTETLTDWADEMSTYIKQLAPNHMVAVGDEGFFNRSGESDWTYNGGEGVDHEALLSLPNIDFGTYHLYPDHWGKTSAWGTQWIEDHIDAAKAIGKPTILEEFGIHNKSTRDDIYQTWIDTVYQQDGAGWMFWILSGIQDGGGLYPDYDGFTVYYPSDTATLLANAAQQMKQKNAGAPTSTPAPPTATVPPTTPTPPPTAVPGTALKVQYRNALANQNDGEITPYFNIVNTGNNSVPLDELTIRYWYTADGNKAQVYTCFWSRVDCANITGGVIKLTSPVEGADHYLEISFSSGAGNIPAQGSGYEIHHRVNRQDWSSYNETNDYSYDGTKNDFADWDRITLYRNGALVWGVEP
ncbi:MAG: Endo-1,4-beta-mannosidase [Chloroflexi bacterium AL-W]|nr:Endo-1,4-beta-mannosidase [Chloroflexi bacterium AL-N1]NOK71304.1 Endo-1,4-beta-mannosidase [Chloroflexi bacterium AL-N10]NOK77679.1 Endo-1,4-beta-mannosidase [Chloroflexi bacterium AL-N5]NOK84530.1 Endo-1,4-beta-mannosidase [Chloroflexi bacterium AL-W]NOK92981.1 Endo-1,4-beta-mannosidase [Chloroflexi bacterium AL-N15]